jgi:serine-type D-Ala-D-Ala carboxypeptidase (penicillin-binding protein 5/6)
MSSSRTARSRRAAIVLAVSAIAAATTIGTTTADAGWSEKDDLGNTTPAGHGNVPDHVDTNGPTEPALPAVSAAAAIVVERGSGVVLGAKNPDLRWAPASTTKMMTGLLAVEAIAAGDVSLSDTVTIQSNVDVEGGGSAGLAPGDTISLRDLLYMMLVSSENDAAHAVGTYVGSEPNGLGPWTGRALFVNRMNERADELGLTNTSYIDISGRDPEDLNEDGNFPEQAGCDDNEFDNPLCAHYSTARDLAELARVALDEPLFASIVRTTDWRTTTWRSSTGAVRDTDYDTSNQLLPGQAQAYPGAYGVKTGTTHMARENLVSAAKRSLQPVANTDTDINPNTAPRPSSARLGPESWGPNVIAVVLGSDDDSTTPANRFTDSRAVLDFGLARAH